MAMRITSLYSGLDTESIISQLVEAKSTKMNTAKKEQTKLGWKQDAWKTLNTKILNLYDNVLGNLRFESSFKKKTTKVSNSDAVSVITGANAVNSVQSLKVNKLASPGNLTGEKLNGAAAYTSSSKLTDSVNNGGLGIAIGSTIEIKTGDKTTNITINEDTTIGSFVSSLKNAGVNASFDEKNQRFFISSTASGKDNDFTITGVNSAGLSEGSDALIALGIGEDVQGTDAQGNPTFTNSTAAGRIYGTDAEIELNGVKFTSDTNTFEINGLTITANATTKEGESISLTTMDDTSGIYNMIKNFFKEYNALINEMDKLYNAASAKDYEPLTAEEKESLSETEIEEWETKIKDSLFRRDDTLGTVSNAMKSIMTSGVEVNGRKMYLSDFGIGTLGYFDAADNEKYAYHIDGDPDNSNTSGKVDKLMTMITTDPDTAVSFFVNLSRSMYSKLGELMEGTEYSTSFTIYEDKKMKTDYNDYTTKIKELEKKLKDYEDKWYAKFSAMEVALSKLQSNSSAITNLLGGGS